MRSGKVICAIFIGLVVAETAMGADELKRIELPKPETDGGKPLMQALKARQSLRSFSPRELPLQVLSNLLWAAGGVNRADSGKLTAPTSSNWQEISIYVARADGLYLYDAKAHALEPVVAEDLRAMSGTQAFVKDAPINLIFVADYAKMGKAADELKDFCAASDTGFVSQNVYLFCASEGLATVVRGLIKRDPLAAAMKLRPDQKITLAQSVGYPSVP